MSKNGLYLTEQSTSSNNGAVRIGGSLYSKNWDNSYKGMHVPNGHGSLFNAMDQDARIIAQCEANKLLWIAEANKQKALENGANLNAPIVPPPPVLNNPVPNNPPLTELEKALAEIKALKEANAAKDTKIKELEEQNKKDLIEFLNKKESDLKTKDLIINNLLENNKDLKTHIEETREDKKELRLEKNEWKAKYEAKDESLQKITQELASEKMKVIELSKKNILLNIHDSDDSNFSVLEKIDNEHNVPIVGQNEIIEQL
jgi:hypothetical protein